MKRKLLIATLFALGSYTVDAAYVPVTVTGFNADVIVNGTGTSNATSSNDVDGVNYCFVAVGWQFSSSNTPITTGLPTTGLITSTNTTGLTYQLASYSDVNSLRLNTATPASLTVTTPMAAQNLFVLATSGSGACVMTAQVNFTDGTNQQVTNISVGDWYGGSPYEIGQIGRILRNTTSTTIETATNGPRLYRYTLAISTANQSKLISSIQFTRTSGPGVLNVFAVSAEANVSCPAPTAPNVTGITTTSAILNWTQAGTATTWQIRYGAPPLNTSTGGTAVITTTKPFTLSSPPLTANTTYEFAVRAICGAGDTSLWSPITSFTTACVAPTVATKADSFNCGTGAVVLKATASTGGTINWYANATGGAILTSGNTFTTPSLTTTTTYYIAAAAGTCESTPRQAVVATIRPIPIVNIGNDTTICPGITYTMNAGNAGATYLWNTNATTQSISVNQAGNYSVLVTLNGCNGSDARTITNGVVPQNNLPATTDLCEGETANLNAGNSGSTFLWSPGGATTQTTNVTTGGTKSVTIKSTTGCVITSNTNVIMRPLPVIALGPDTSICEGATIVLDAGNPTYNHLWTPGSATTQTLNVTDSGKYSVTVTTPYNCVSTAERHVAFLPSPRVEGFNFIPLFYENLGKVKFNPLNPRSVESYLWDFGDGTATSTLTSPTHTYAASGYYTVTLKVFNGCSQYETSLLIHVDNATGIVTLGKDEANVILYPNPANGFINLENRSTDIRLQEVTVFNTLGAVVYKAQLSGNRSQLPTSRFAAGIYSLRILTDKGFVVRKFEVRR
ncbi:PKD domain-containing protein [Taibaiella chishuiensis]|uniref:Putative secreted protein (Por secretion system target) n=1 Tax=Taibaiella chishuiensis TaxID=1434707 RepID=A0A2P8CYR5_9BACT|nr:PKD domain-containing protein [Taibaiella chishuiensis]PSK90112.1 putative secreted protein (Por secretion system target) [Taibaiella chishuiensis]